MATMPGMITDFAGHKQGASGYESKKNNIYQQNRNRINWEWTDENFEEDNIPVVQDFAEKINNIIQLRNDSDLSALTRTWLSTASSIPIAAILKMRSICICFPFSEKKYRSTYSDEQSYFPI